MFQPNFLHPSFHYGHCKYVGLLEIEMNLNEETIHHQLELFTLSVKPQLRRGTKVWLKIRNSELISTHSLLA